MATYVNNLRLKEIATGDESGTWGTSTNTNLELIGEALGIGTEAITTNADTHSTVVADGSADAGRAMYLKYTGTLDSACTITITPNTMKRVQIIENATSGSQNIIISQGSGANVTIGNGKVAIVQLDGAGSGAAVLDALTDLQVTDTLSVNGTTITLGDGTAEDTKLVFDGNAQDFYIGLDDSADDLLIGLGSTVGTTPIISVDENKDVAIPDGGLTITTSDNTDQLSLVSTDADANVGPNIRMYRNSGSPADNDYIGEIQFEGRNDNSQDVVYAGLASRIVDASDGTEDGRFELYTILAGAQNSRVLANSTETVINEDSVDLDFRVESNGNANMLFVDGGNDNVHIANNTTGFHSSVQPLIVGSGSGDEGMAIFSGSSNKGKIGFADAATDDSGSYRGYFQYDHSDDSLNIGTAGSEVMSIASNGNTTLSGNLTMMSNVVYASQLYVHDRIGHLNDASTFIDFDTDRIEFATNGEAMRIDSNKRLVIGATSPEGRLDVNEDTAGVWAGVFENTASGGAGVLIKSAGDTGSENVLDVRNGTGTIFKVTQAGANVNIGNGDIANPTLKIHSAAGGDPTLKFDTGAVNRASFIDFLDQGTQAAGIEYDHNANSMRFSVASNNRSDAMRLDSSGNFLVGTTSNYSPAGRMAVKSVANGGTTPAASFQANTSTSSGSILVFYAGDGDEVGGVGMSNLNAGTSVAFNTSSDARWKDVTGEAQGLEVINKLNPVAFNWKKSGLSDEGLIAQEVQEHLPNIVNEGSNGYLQMDYSKLVTPLIKAVQELSAEVEQLKQQAHEKCEN